MSSEPFIGIQVDPPSRRGELSAFCAKLRELANVNQLLCFFSPDELHRSERYSLDINWGWTQANVAETPFDRLNEAAAAQGMRIFLGGGELSWHQPEPVPGCEPYRQIDCFGVPTKLTCVNNQAWREYNREVHVDALEKNAFLAGFMFMHERSGPFQQIFKPEAAWQGAFTPGCFCPDCVKLGEAAGIDVEKARLALRKLVELFRDGSAAAKRDGVFTDFWRQLTRYPEALAWEHFQWESLHRYRSDLADAMRAVRPGLTVGYHFQNCSHFGNLPWRAGDDPERIRDYADWVKPSIYPGVSGKRYRGTLDYYRQTWLADLPEEVEHATLSAWFKRDSRNGREVLGGTPESRGIDGQVSFGADWCEVETRRITDGCAPKPCYAGLGIGIPGGEKADRADLLAECTHACLDGGAEGFLISRHTSEMRDEYLAAVGAVIRERMF